MPDRFSLIGVGRSELTTEQFREKMAEAIRTFTEEKEPDFSRIDSFLNCFYYRKINYNSARDYAELKLEIEKSCSEKGIAGNIIFYMATPPDVYVTISNSLYLAGLSRESEGYRRFIIEKPFGTDLASAVKLNRTLHELVDEKQIFRIDHYLGKETVQNLLVTRFANGIFELSGKELCSQDRNYFGRSIG